MNDGNFGWRALRLLARRSPHFFTHSNNPINKLPEYLETMIKKIAKDRPVSIILRIFIHCLVTLVPSTWRMNLFILNPSIFVHIHLVYSFYTFINYCVGVKHSDTTKIPIAQNEAKILLL